MADASSKAGRREAGADTRSLLLDAAARLTVARGIEPLSLREIADAAGVNPAMVRYHFGDKSGLMCALLDHGFDALFEAVPAEADLDETVEALVSWLHDNRWLTALMTRSVYAGAELRGRFETEHAPRLLALYRGALERGRRAGEVRSELDPGFAVTALISLVVFPGLAGPMFDRVLGPELRAPQGYAAQIVKLFQSEGGTDA